MFWNQSNRFETRSKQHVDNLIDSIFDEMVEPFNRTWKAASVRSTHVVEETETSHKIHIAVPGHTAKSVTVETDPARRVLTVTADNSENCNKLIATTLSMEFKLPVNTDPESIEAEVKDGVLIVEVAKRKPETGKPVQVKVK